MSARSAFDTCFTCAVRSAAVEATVSTRRFDGEQVAYLDGTDIHQEDYRREQGEFDRRHAALVAPHSTVSQ